LGDLSGLVNLAIDEISGTMGLRGIDTNFVRAALFGRGKLQGIKSGYQMNLPPQSLPT
jgi:hypothetical protein